MPATKVEHLSDDVTIYLGDCRDILPTLGRMDAVVSDPPYGMSWENMRRLSEALNQPGLF